MQCRARLIVKVLVLALACCYARGNVNTDLDDLLSVLAQRQHLNPRPRLLPFLVNPFSPLLLCDHHFGTEREPDPDIVINPLTKDNIDAVRPCANVCVNAKAFEAFVTDVLPLIRTRIILFTSRFHLPQVERSPMTDAAKAHPAISHLLFKGFFVFSCKARQKVLTYPQPRSRLRTRLPSLPVPVHPCASRRPHPTFPPPLRPYSRKKAF
jgi:hypothetical protein